jgi:hypothetical protein
MRTDAIPTVEVSPKLPVQSLGWFRTVAAIERGAVAMLDVLIGIGHLFWPALALAYLAVRFHIV